MGRLNCVWTEKAKAQLKQIHDYLKYTKRTPQGAKNIKQDILTASRGLIYAEQYQKDDINPNYRRIIVRHYKLIYKDVNMEQYSSYEFLTPFKIRSIY